jgi:FAD/FMN-containing dehydrogenase
MVKRSSWGRLGHQEHRCVPLWDRSQALALMRQTTPGLPFGKGRSYGDVCLNPGGTLWETDKLDRFISFNSETGILKCEAGVQLGDIQRTMSARGWMLSVTPGTQYVTVGGAIANDVHGKNHHAFGTFGEHVLALQLLRSDGTVMECTPDSNQAMLRATIAGLGLTGVILTATLQLRPVTSRWLLSETIPYSSLDEFFAVTEQSVKDWEYTVSWIDCLSGKQARGIYFRANHASATKAVELPQNHKPARRLAVPVTPPVSLTNTLTLRAMNSAYFRLNRANTGTRYTDYESFFYPLDRIGHWNRLYGPTGFYQYQCVIPGNSSQSNVTALLTQIKKSGQGSFLAVLKTFADRQPAGMLSFPREGVTLALDFPNRGSSTLRLFDTLDAIVEQAGGRLYPAKDARMPAAVFAAGYPALAEFARFRDPGISSAMSRRLLGY